jgi:signal transduction histidine kinase
VQLNIEKERYHNTQELSTWANSIERVLKDPSTQPESLHVKIPTSVIYSLGLYDSNGGVIYTNLPFEPTTFSFSTSSQDGYFYLQKILSENSVNALRLVVAKPVSYTKIALVGAAVLFLMICVIYITAHFMIQSSIKPYKQTQDYMNNFFNDAMHELKTPLGVIHINLELLEATNTESKYIGRMKAATKQMQMTYEDVEYYIKHTRASFNPEVIDLSAYMQERVRFFEDIARAKQIILKSQIAPKCIVFMNKTELQRIIDNTISNAIKYSNPASSVLITLTCKDSRAYFCVQDFGRGIKDTKRIFERFEREDLVQGGFGLGLSIVKKICDKYGITYEVQSTLGKGSTFTYAIVLYEEKWLDRLESNK